MISDPQTQPSSKDTRIDSCLLNRDGQLDFIDGFVNGTEADSLLAAFHDTLDWREEFLRIAGRSVRVPRRVAWHGDPGAIYRYSGVTHEPRPWTPALLALRNRIQTYCKTPFNSVLGNLYTNGMDSMGWHADNEPELGQNPWIASLSLGAERRFEIRHDATREILRIPLSHGSLLVMRGGFQHHWQHRIPRQPGIMTARINLTFRYLHISD